MALAHGVVKLLRMLHLYLGVFAAPALLFFALTGGLQTFSLHETTRGRSYTPPAWLASAAQLHKKATIVMPVRRARLPVARGAGGATEGAAVQGMAQPDATPVPRAADPKAAAPATRAPAWLLAMKIFFALISLSLLLSVLSGLVIAYRISRRPHLLNALILAGTLLPIVLLL
jgi:hypothetical protein